jgi:hypothetical protein
LSRAFGQAGVGQPDHPHAAVGRIGFHRDKPVGLERAQ